MMDGEMAEMAKKYKNGRMGSLIRMEEMVG